MTRRALSFAVLGTGLGVLPVYLLGGLAVQLRADLGFTEAQLGLAISAFFATSALASVPAGRLVERTGAVRGMMAALAISVTSMALMGSARGWAPLVAGVALGGLSNAVAQLAANLALTQAVPSCHQGLGFGVKQAAVPAASVLAGVAVPLVAVPLGWRSAFFIGAALAVVVTLWGPRPATAAVLARPKRGPLRAGDAPLLPLLVLAAAGAFGTAAANSLAAFLVESSVSRGVRPATAGVLLAVGSGVGVTVRVLAGWAADHRDGGHLRVVAMLMATGTVGLGLLAVAGTAPRILLGAVLAFGSVWGWNGVFNLAVIRRNPRAPAAATGITQAGLYLGGVVGPTAFGRSVELWSYAAAWSGLAVASMLAAGGILAGRALLRAA